MLRKFLNFASIFAVLNYVTTIPWLCKYLLNMEIHMKIFVRFSKSALAKLDPKVQWNALAWMLINKRKNTKQAQV